VKKAVGLVLLAVVAVLVTGGASALADKPGYVCTGGDILGSSGPYDSVTVTGVCRFSGDVTINGDLTIADGAVLNNHATQIPFQSAHVTINGNVKVGKGAVLGLGNYGPPGIKTNTVVNGNINANQPLDLYLSGITVHGNVNSNGGGPGTSQFLNFPTKDDVVDGNLVMQGWSGGWIGIIRDVVGGTSSAATSSSPRTRAWCTRLRTAAGPSQAISLARAPASLRAGTTTRPRSIPARSVAT
jgi:hypothetical protein